MADASAAISPRRSDLPERGEASAERALPYSHDSKELLIVIVVISLALWVGSPYGFVAAALFFSVCFVAIAIVFACWEYIEGMHFFVFNRPYNVGDWIEVSPLGSSSSLEKENIWRVKKITLFHTELASLSRRLAVSLVPCKSPGWCNKLKSLFIFSKI